MTEKNPFVIGLVGPAGSGKSTVANYLVEKYGAKRYSLAGPLKQIAVKMFPGAPRERFYGSQKEKETRINDDRGYYAFTGRSFLQALGVACRKEFGADFWPKICADQIEKEFPPIAVIDDMRFVSEAELFQFRPHLDAQIWRLWPIDDEETAARAKAAGDHVSEQEWREISADREIKPRMRDLEELFGWIDIAMALREERPS